MAPTDPIPWAPLVELGAHTCLQCEAVFERRRGDLDPDWDREAAVASLYEWWHDAYGADLGKEQGGVYVFAYLLEASDHFDTAALRTADEAPITGSLLDRRPPAETLERWFWEDEQVPWWIAVRCGVHYSLVHYWFYESEIPLMRRNVPDRLLDRIEG
ncbi:MAG: hypothetical protein ABEH59_01900 [Halobacteriales archaeon]